MEFGAHLPLMDFGGHPFTLDYLLRYARTAEQLGFDMLCANDHLVFAVPWLDGPTALAATIEASGQMTLATTVALVAVRGPVPVAKALYKPATFPAWIGARATQPGLSTPHGPIESLHRRPAGGSGATVAVWLLLNCLPAGWQRD